MWVRGGCGADPVEAEASCLVGTERAGGGRDGGTWLIRGANADIAETIMPTRAMIGWTAKKKIATVNYIVAHVGKMRCDLMKGGASERR